MHDTRIGEIRLSSTASEYVPLTIEQLFGLVHDALLSKAVEHGMGRHMAYLDPTEREGTLK